jgi:hypothetical protein
MRMAEIPADFTRDEREFVERGVNFALDDEAFEEITQRRVALVFGTRIRKAAETQRQTHDPEDS